MQNSFWLISKADFDVRFVFSVVENPGVLSGVETISEIEISTKIMFKKWCFVISVTKSVIQIFLSQF